jgi:cell wall-associated NlpC family hydrolase
MAGQGMTFLRAGRRYGVDPRLLVGIATIESGAGAHLAQPFNPFNWSIHQGKQYGSWQESIMDVARGLRRGYYDQGLKTPQQIVSKYAPGSDNNNEGNWASVVSQVMSQLGGPTIPQLAGAAPRSAAPTQAASPPLSPQAPLLAQPTSVFDPKTFSTKLRNQFISGAGRVDLGNLAQTRAESYKAMPVEALEQQGIVDPGGDLADPPPEGAPKGGNRVTKIAGTQIGKPYVFGSGADTSSFDCSDLIQWSYKQMGISLPRTTFDQIKSGRAVDFSDYSNLKPGDLVFPTGHHVVMYVGGGKVIAAPHTGTVVQYQPLSQFGQLLAVRRVL